MYHTPANLSFIDELCVKRLQLIDQMGQAFTLMSEAYKTTLEIDGDIPISSGALPDSMELIFHDFRAKTGEFVKTAPKVSWLKTLSHEKIKASVVESVDRRLWLMLFNRLNINALLTGSYRKQIHEQLESSCLEFTAANVQSTLMALCENREATLISSLYDAVCTSDPSYRSNSRKMFRKRTVFSEAVALVNGHYYKPVEHGSFRDVLKFLSFFIFGENLKSQHHIVQDDYLYKEVSNAFAGYSHTSANDKVIYFSGGEVRFFNKGTAHLILGTDLVDYLNAVLSQSNALYS